MTTAIQAKWSAAGLPFCWPQDVAKVIAGVACDKEQNGNSFYVEGGRAWEIEKNLDRLEPQWLGEEQSKLLNRGPELLEQGEGSLWGV